MNWISVKEKLPETIIYCLIYYCEDWNYNKLWRIGWCFYNSLGEWCIENSKVNPTHWMPIPDPPDKEKNKESGNVKEILDYLNYTKRKMTDNQALRGYRETTAVKRIINGRLKEKFTVDDFKTVIDYKADAWKGTTYDKYLQPSTLFSATHFPEYLCEAEAGKKPATEPFQEGEAIHSAEDVYNRMRKEAGK